MPLLAALLVAALGGCTVCTEQLVDESTSPNHQWTTRTTVRDCGQLATPTTNIYLQRAGSRQRLGEIVVLVRRVHTVKVSWAGDAQIRVECAGCGSDVKIARPNAHGVAITVSR